jgi:hypothetical protein
MKYFKQLLNITEATPQDKRLGARLRKRRQRERENVTRQTNPFDMILVVKNKSNGEILIIDKESYDPRYHEILISPEEINQSTISGILKDPKFVQTETSKRLFGDVKENQPKQEKEEKQAPSQQSGQKQGGEEQQRPQAGSTPPPKKEIPFTQNNKVSGPVIALGMMAGMQGAQLQKMGVTPEQLEEYNSSMEIQEVSNKIASQIKFYFKNVIGRDISEYVPVMIDEQPFQTTDLWKKMGGYDSAPKANIVFRHICVEASGKNEKCQKENCECIKAGVSPSETSYSFAIKYGPSSIINGKLNNDTETTFYSTINLIDQLILNQPVGLEQEFDEKELSAIEKLQDDVKFIKKIAIQKIDEKILRPNQFPQKNQNPIKQIEKIVDDISRQIERVINSNILYKEYYLFESLTGYVKFSPGSPGFASGIISIMPNSYDVAMRGLDLDFVRKIADNEDNKITFNLKSNLFESPDEKTDLEICKARFGGKCPKASTPKKYAIRMLISSFLNESKFTHSSLRYLFEQEDPEAIQGDFMQILESAETIQDLMNIFSLTPNQITITPIDLFGGAAIDYSSERNFIKVNGKMFQIPVQIDQLPPNDLEDMTESFSFMKTLLERKKRNYRKEYDEYHSKPDQRSNRSKRVLARRKMMKLGKVRKGDGQDVDHINGNPQDNSVDNLKAVDKSHNRGKH